MFFMSLINFIAQLFSHITVGPDFVDLEITKEHISWH